MVYEALYIYGKIFTCITITLNKLVQWFPISKINTMLFQNLDVLCRYNDVIWTYVCFNFRHCKDHTHIQACIFSAPEPKAQVHYCDHALSVVRRPSLLTFHIFDFFSETIERNSTKLDRKQDFKVFYHVCFFRADRKNKMAVLASDWLRHFQLLLWNRWTEFMETWQEARSQHPLPSLCFSGRSGKQDGHPGLWLAETFSTSPLKPPNGIHRNLTGSKISTSSTTFVFFGPIGKTRWPPWPLIGWDIFDFSSETAERNSTKVDRKQDLNVLYQVCVFRADRKNKMAALASDWLRHFRLLLWTEFIETWGLIKSFLLVGRPYFQKNKNSKFACHFTGLVKKERKLL